MAIPVARVHLAMEHAALPPLLPTPPPCVAAIILPKPHANKPSRADSDERWDAHKTRPPSAESSASSCTSSLKGSTCKISRSRASSTERWDAHKKAAASPASSSTTTSSSSCTSFLKGSTCAISRSRASSTERWDAHKKAASPASSSSTTSSSSSGTSFLKGSTCAISRSRASCTERWDEHRKRRFPPQAELLDDDGERSSTGSNDNIETEEEIVWKPRATAIYAEPCFTSAAPEPSMLPMPTAFLLRIA